VIYQNFNGDFKSHINFGGQKEDNEIKMGKNKRKKQKNCRTLSPLRIFAVLDATGPFRSHRRPHISYTHKSLPTLLRLRQHQSMIGLLSFTLTPSLSVSENVRRRIPKPQLSNGHLHLLPNRHLPLGPRHEHLRRYVLATPPYPRRTLVPAS
jgi:hypothetical protein